MTKTYTAEEEKMKIEPDKVLVVKRNGEKIIGRKFSKPGSFNIDGHWVKVDGIKYQLDELTAYQDTKAYYMQFGPIWVKQLKRGKINLFSYDQVTYNSMEMANMPRKDETETHFVFQKGDGKLLELSVEAISELLADNKRAQDEFNAQFKPGRVILPKQLQNHPTVLFDVIDIYNGNK
ncbi:MAG TPA: hypothetical protein VE035_11480 [Puia sp.]|nr:hypothetical protein [Puia sp.]